MPEWTGVWPGTVVNDRDPEFRCRLQVRLDQVYGALDDPTRIPDELLPWAEACVPCTGLQCGVVAVPGIGAPVWVVFWGGDPEQPVWLGGWFAPSDVIAGHRLSYAAGGPASYHLRTPKGQEIQLRWDPGSEGVEISTSAGDRCLLADVGNAVGRRIELSTKEGTSISIDGTTQNITVAGLGDLSSVIAGMVTSEVQGSLELTVVQGMKKTVGSLVETVLGTALKTFVGALTVDCQGIANVVVAGALSITSVGLSILTTGAALALGSSGGSAKQALMTEDFISFFNTHTHAVPGGGTSDPPLIPAPPGLYHTAYVVAD